MNSASAHASKLEQQKATAEFLDRLENERALRVIEKVKKDLERNGFRMPTPEEIEVEDRERHKRQQSIRPGHLYGELRRLGGDSSQSDHKTTTEIGVFPRKYVDPESLRENGFVPITEWEVSPAEHHEAVMILHRAREQRKYEAEGYLDLLLRRGPLVTPAMEAEARRIVEKGKDMYGEFDEHAWSEASETGYPQRGGDLQADDEYEDEYEEETDGEDKRPSVNAGKLAPSKP